MELTTYYGFICPKCKSTVNIGISEPNCPDCGTMKVPNKQGTPILTNVTCKKCNAFFGMTDSDKCPDCGTKFNQ
jgi:rubrerythrin